MVAQHDIPPVHVSALLRGIGAGHDEVHLATSVLVFCTLPLAVHYRLIDPDDSGTGRCGS